jgi:alkyl sulfatase BDS1-like metallo-beta-lactamase superfamily hydrolase
MYEVSDGTYQIRGFDMSNMTLVEGDQGVVVIDPLISEEVAAAALALYRTHRGDRPVTAVIYTHSHIDHFGGVLGVVEADTTVPIYAPEHFLDHAVAENVYAGTAMLRRSYYYAAVAVPKSSTGTLGIGLGAGGSTGRAGLIAPTHDITHTGQEEVIDGVRLQFQMTPGTEAPAEMNFLLPDRRVLCLAENATHNLHNILTLRGAEVRDARMWSRYLAEAIELFSGKADVAIASHHWPTWGAEAIVEFLTEQRDLYAYLHDQTLRLLNKGYIGSEIAEMVELPPGWTGPGTPTATTAPPATTSRPSTSATSAGTTGTRHTCGNIPRRPPPPATWSCSGESTPPSPGPRRTPTRGTRGSRRSWQATPSSPRQRTARHGSSWPRCWSGSATAPRTRPGATRPGTRR